MNHSSDRTSRSPLSVIGGGLLFVIATVTAVKFARAGEADPTSPFVPTVRTATAAKPESSAVIPAATAFGRSGNVNVKFALPGRQVDFPVDMSRTSEPVTYQWLRQGDSTTSDVPSRLGSATLTAPPRPGFYQLLLTIGTTRQVMPEPMLAVMVPFDQKIAGSLNGYRIGTYIAERFGQEDHDRPEGFVEVRADQLGLQLSRHLTLADFVTHDEQNAVWPKYVAVNSRLLDKLELVFTELGGAVRPDLAVDVHSGFRSPSHNARVPRAASDSRHQYGDAADVVVDADGDGHITMTDEMLVMLAVEKVEDKHPDLAGGLGLYISRRYPVPYVHIDARGKRARWKG